MEHITVAGHPEPVAMSATAARLMRERLDQARDRRGDADSDAYETRIGQRIGVLLEGGMPSIDMATMRAIVDFVETPEEPEDAEPTGLGKVFKGINERLERRGYRGP